MRRHTVRVWFRTRRGVFFTLGKSAVRRLSRDGWRACRRPSAKSRRRYHWRSYPTLCLVGYPILAQKQNSFCHRLSYPPLLYQHRHHRAPTPDLSGEIFIWTSFLFFHPSPPICATEMQSALTFAFFLFFTWGRLFLQLGTRAVQYRRVSPYPYGVQSLAKCSWYGFEAATQHGMHVSKKG